MGNGLHLTTSYTGQRRPIQSRLAGTAGVFDLFSFRFFYEGNRYFPERVIGIFIPNFKEVSRAGRDAVPATVTSIRIDAYEKLSRTVIVSEIGNQKKNLVAGYRF